MFINGYAVLELSGMKNVELFGAVGDGATDCTAAINDALNAGGVSFFPAGTYLTEPFSLEAGAYLVGVGSGTFVTPSRSSQMSILKPLPGSMGNFITGPSGTSDVKIIDIQLDGADLDGAGIALPQGNPQEAQWCLERTYIHHFGKSGIDTGHGRRGIHLKKCTVTNNGEKGIILRGSDSVIDECTIGLNAAEGIVVLDAVVRIRNCDVFWNLCGIAVGYTFGCLVSGCSIDRNYRNGFYIAPTSDGISLMGNVFNSNSQESDGLYAHIDVDGAERIAVVGNSFTDVASDAPNRPSYCIYLRPGASVAGMDTNVMHPNASVNGFTNVPPDNW